MDFSLHKLFSVKMEQLRFFSGAGDGAGGSRCSAIGGGGSSGDSGEKKSQIVFHVRKGWPWPLRGVPGPLRGWPRPLRTKLWPLKGPASKRPRPASERPGEVMDGWFPPGQLPCFHNSYH